MKDTLKLWQERFADAKSKYQEELDRMDRREKRYAGDHTIYDPQGNPTQESALHVRNIVLEMIETQVDSNIPQPKVTALHPEDEELARVIEDMLRMKLDQLPMETINDMAERTCPLQGGVGLLPEWDETQGGHSELGDTRLTLLHPKKIIPQPGVYEVEEMDWYFITAERTKGYIKRHYGVDVTDEEEEDPEIREVDGSRESDSMVTQIYAYFRNDSGGVGLVSWVGDTLLIDREDFWRREIRRCRKCGTIGDGLRCRHCGGKKFDVQVMDREELDHDITLSDGRVIPASAIPRDENGLTVMQTMDTTGGMLLQMPGGISNINIVAPAATTLPYYAPKNYPLLIRKNVSRYGAFLGSSDADAIEDQQNTMLKLSTKKLRKVLGGGSVLIKPQELTVALTDDDMQVIEITKPQQASLIGVKNLQVDIGADIAAENAMYEESRQMIGITDSMQGRRDPTATSMVAKQFAAAQAAGRMESKKIMKEAFFADLFRAIFQLMLAYADEPRPMQSQDAGGKPTYREFNRYDFLKQDAAGEWYFEDGFLFSTDAAASLANNREAMWKENRENLMSGAYGDPHAPDALLMFWRTMEKLSYPMAGMAVKHIEQQMEQAQQAQQAQAAAMAAQVQVQPEGGLPTQINGISSAVPTAQTTGI